MVDREANIDLFFRNGLKDYEVLPPDDVWEGIRPVLKKKKQSGVFLRLAASLAIIISLGAGSMFILNKPVSRISGPAIAINQPLATEVNSVQAIPAGHPSRIYSTGIQEKPVAESSNENVYQTVLNYSLPEPQLYAPFVKEKKVRNRMADISAFKKEANQDVSNSSGKSILSQTDLAVNDDNASVPKNTRWNIGANIIPSYYSSFTFSKDDAAKEMINAEQAAVSYSGGFSFAYSLNRRISIQTGIYYSSIGQKVTGVDSYSGFNKYYTGKGASQFSVLTSNGKITTNNNDIYLSDNNSGSRVLTTITREVFDPVKANLPYIDNTLHQDFNYLEIPFMMKYKVIDRKVDFNVTGGLSYNLLINNSAYAMTGGEKFYVGTTGNLSPVTFSSSLGMGVEYNFSRSLSLNLEPTFRYYITPLGGMAGSSIHPYSFGVLSGISFKF